MHKRGIRGGRARNTRQRRGLGQTQFIRMLAEVELRRSFKTKVAVAQIHLVGVHGEDLGLGEVALNLDGQQHFLEFSTKALVGRQEKHLAELLGQGAGALRLAPLQNILAGGAEDAEDIHSPMALEMPVLNGDHRVAQEGGIWL